MSIENYNLNYYDTKLINENWLYSLLLHNISGKYIDDHDLFDVKKLKAKLSAFSLLDLAWNFDILIQGHILQK